MWCSLDSTGERIVGDIAPPTYPDSVSAVENDDNSVYLTSDWMTHLFPVDIIGVIIRNVKDVEGERTITYGNNSAQVEIPD